MASLLTKDQCHLKKIALIKQKKQKTPPQPIKRRLNITINIEFTDLVTSITYILTYETMVLYNVRVIITLTRVFLCFCFDSGPLRGVAVYFNIGSRFSISNIG